MQHIRKKKFFFPVFLSVSFFPRVLVFLSFFLLFFLSFCQPCLFVRPSFSLPVFPPLLHSRSFFHYFFFYLFLSSFASFPFLSPPPPPPLPTLSLFLYRLVGLVVKASASRVEDPGFESRLRRDFYGVE